MRKAPGAVGAAIHTRRIDRTEGVAERRLANTFRATSYRSPVWILRIVRASRGLPLTGTTVVPVRQTGAAVLSHPAASPMTRDVGVRRARSVGRGRAPGTVAVIRRLPVPKREAAWKKPTEKGEAKQKPHAATCRKAPKRRAGEADTGRKTPRIHTR